MSSNEYTCYKCIHIILKFVYCILYHIYTICMFSYFHIIKQTRTILHVVKSMVHGPVVTPVLRVQPTRRRRRLRGRPRRHRGDRRRPRRRGDARRGPPVRPVVLPGAPPGALPERLAAGQRVRRRVPATIARRPMVRSVTRS